MKIIKKKKKLKRIKSKKVESGAFSPAPSSSLPVVKHDPSEIPTSIIISGVESDRYWNIVVNKCQSKTVLMSYQYLQKKEKGFLAERLEKTPDVKVFIDSGAYTFMANVDKFEDMPEKFWKDYLEKYVDFIKHNAEHVFACADLDLDKIVGEEQVDEWRKEYFQPLKDLGIDVCYIWHAERGFEGWKEMCEKYDYIGLSTENDSLSVQQLTKMINYAKKHGTRVHGMALTQTELLVRIPFFSADSSVDGKSSVLVKDLRNDRTFRTTIEELYNRNISSEFQTTNYETRVPYEGYQVLTVDNNNKIIWGDLYGVVKHKVKKPTVRLKIEGGKEIVCTTDHSVITMDKEGNLKETLASELKAGDFVMSPREFDTGNELVPFTNVLIDKPRTQSGKKEWQVVEVSDKFLNFLGLWIGDGHHSSDTTGLSCYQDKECRDVINYIANLYGAKVTVEPNGVDARISNVRLQRILKALGFEGTSKTKRVPKFIYSLSKPQICQFLKGYFSADGTGSCECSTVSEELKNDLVELLSMLGITTSVSYRESKPYSIRGVKGTTSEIWHISIRNRQSKILFRDYIGFLQDYKNKKLNNIISNTPIREPKCTGIPKSLAVGTLVRTDSKHATSVLKWKGNRISRKYEGVFCDKVRNSEVLFLEIKSIEVVNDGSKEVDVYDLSVRCYERFFANGILVHNTTWLVGQQYGELNWFDGRKMKRLKKREWQTTYKTRLLKAPFFADWDLLINGMGGRGDTYELLRLNVLAYHLAEEHIRKRLRTKMYWLRENDRESSETAHITSLAEAHIPNFEWFDGDCEDYRTYLHDLGFDVEIPKEEALDLLYSIYIYCIDSSHLEDEKTEDMYNYCKAVLEREPGSREEAESMIREFLTANVLGERHDFAGENIEGTNAPKERMSYVQDDEYVTINISPEDLSATLPPPEGSSMPEVEAYDKELAKRNISIQRDSHGRFVKGTQKVRKPKSVYSKVLPKLACDTCYKAGDCEQYKPGYVCAFSKEFRKFDTRNMDDIMDAMSSMANVNLERMQRAMMFEVMDGGMTVPEVNNLIDQNMRILKQMSELNNSRTIVTQKSVYREDGTQETVTRMSVNPQGGGILSKIFGMGGSKEDMEEEENDSKQVHDVDYKVE